MLFHLSAQRFRQQRLAPLQTLTGQLEARVGKAVDAALAAHPDKDLIVVAHFGAILTQLQRSEKLTAYEAFGHKIDNLSVTEIDITEAGWHTKAINHTP